MKAETLLDSYKNFISMCVYRDIEDVDTIQYLFKLHIENSQSTSKEKSE